MGEAEEEAEEEEAEEAEGRGRFPEDEEEEEEEGERSGEEDGVVVSRVDRRKELKGSGNRISRKDP